MVHAKTIYLSIQQLFTALCRVPCTTRGKQQNLEGVISFPYAVVQATISNRLLSIAFYITIFQP